MLDLMRRKLQRLKIILWVVIFGLTVGMLLLFVDVGGRGGDGLSADTLATVDGQNIDASQFRVEYRRMQDRYRRQFGESAEQFFKMMRLGNTTLDKMIKDVVIQREAKRLGLEVTPAEILDYLRKIPGLSENGRFIGRPRMEQILQSNNMSLQEFEAGIINELLNLKLRSILTGGIRVTENDIREAYSESKQKASIEYVAFKSDDYVKDVAIVESELAAFFEKNKEKYRVGEQRRIQFLLIPDASLRSKVQVSDAEIKRAGLSLEEQTEVRARHILFKVEDPSKENEIKTKATAVLEEARKGVDFGELAKKHSQDGSAANGGDLGYFKAGAMVPEFSNAAFALAPGQISDLVRSQFGFHIIKVEDRKAQSPEQRRMQIEQSLVTQKLDELGRRTAEEIAGMLRSGQDIKKVAGDRGVEVSETGFFKATGAIPGLGDVSGLQGQVFGIKSIGEIGTPVKSATGYLVPKWIEKKDPYLPALSEVRNEVVEGYKKEKAIELAEIKAKAFAQALKNGEEINAAAKKAGRSVSKPAPFARRQSIDENLQSNPEVVKAVFEAKVGQSSEAIKAYNNVMVFRLLAMDSFDEVQYAKERSSLRQVLQDKRKVVFYQAYLDKKEQELRDQKKVQVNQTLLDQIAS